jgi:hypothetical protein
VCRRLLLCTGLVLNGWRCGKGLVTGRVLWWWVAVLSSSSAMGWRGLRCGWSGVVRHWQEIVRAPCNGRNGRCGKRRGACGRLIPRGGHSRTFGRLGAGWHEKCGPCRYACGRMRTGLPR